jgi:hypothetical protein
MGEEMDSPMARRLPAFPVLAQALVRSAELGERFIGQSRRTCGQYDEENECAHHEFEAEAVRIGELRSGRNGSRDSLRVPFLPMLAASATGFLRRIGRS